jgi:gas vesicle protein
MRRTLSFLAGMLTGSLVGAVIGLLFAPASGENMRARMRNSIATMQQEVRQAAVQRRAELQGQLEAMRGGRPPRAE